MGLIGDIAGLFGSSGDEDAIRRALAGLNPEAGASAYAGLTRDPVLRGTQMDTLGALKSIAGTGGLRTQDQVAYKQVQDQAAQQEASQRQAVLQSAAARGMAGSGADLQGQLTAEQGAANRVSAAGNQTAATADQRALQALSQSGTMAGQVRGQDFGEAAQKASALDAMTQFNAGQRVKKVGMQTQAYGDMANRDQSRYGKFGDDAAGVVGSFL